MANAAEKRRRKGRPSGRWRAWRDAFVRGVRETWRGGDRAWHRRPAVRKGMLAVAVVGVLSVLLLPDIQFIPSRYQVGTIASKNIKASQDFDVPDPKATEEKRHQVEQAAPAVYDFDLAVIEDLRRRLVEAVDAAREAYAGGTAETEAGRTATETERLARARKRMQEILEVPVPKRAVAALAAEGFAPDLAQRAGDLLKDVLNQGVVEPTGRLAADAQKGILLKGVGAPLEKEIHDVSVFLDVAQARRRILKEGWPLLEGLSPESARAVRELAAALVVPNVTFNKKETEEARLRAREAVKTVFYKVQKGEMIVREGERISEEQMAKLNALNAAQRENNIFRVFLGLVAFNALLLAVFLVYINRFKRSIAEDLQKLSLLGLIIVGSMGLIKVFYWIAREVMANLEFVDPGSVLYGIPFAFCGMLIGVLFEVRIFLFPILIISILSGMMIGNDLSFTLYSLVGNVTAALTVQNCRRRSALLRGGMMVGGANVLAALALGMVHNEPGLQKALTDALFAFSGGVLVSVLVSWVVPILEYVFKITTDIRLLELSDTNQQVLKDLLVHAPGTYQHSLMVGNLSEEAAEAVGANPLLARVSSLYHDIGKIHKAEYFVENQINLENRHDRLAPSMSALILTSHVKDGVELAKENKLPPAILDIIRQHHGTSLITYFYQKAKEQEDPSIHAVKEEDYRYPGPKPQTREAAIVMIADAIEAASRVLTNPTASRIEQMVNKILERIYLDGQLDECDLTLKDLRLIKKSLMPILNSIHHHRIDYPSVKLAEDHGKGKEKGDEGPTPPAGARPKDLAEPGEVRLEKSLRNRP